MRALLWSSGVDFFLGEARRPSEQDLLVYREDMRDQIYFFHTERKLKYFGWQDLSSLRRKATGTTPGGDNSLFLISPEEEREIVKIEESRQARVEAKIAAEESEREKAREKAIEQSRKEHKPILIDRFVTSECSGGEIDCSFDICEIFIDATGKEIKHYSHCY